MMIQKRSYGAPPICEKEILRYAGCQKADGKTTALMRACLKEAETVLTYRVVWRELTVSATEDGCDFGLFSLRSKNLAKNLSGCDRVILLAATVGVGLDRLIAKYGRVSPAKALMLQAIGAERIEALCDVFCEDLVQELRLSAKPRFSPGYGDLSLSAQKDIFAALECEKHLGLYLSDSLLMTPSKSVTAFMGLTCGEKTKTANKCTACNKTDCAFRGAV